MRDAERAWQGEQGAAKGDSVEALRDAGSCRQPGLKQEAPEQQYAQDQGDGDDYDLDQTHD